jgi:hypothetical protein
VCRLSRLRPAYKGGRIELPHLHINPSGRITFTVAPPPPPLSHNPGNPWRVQVVGEAVEAASAVVVAVSERGRCGRNRRAGAASSCRSPSPTSPSSSQEERCSEFILRIDEDLLDIKRLPDMFVDTPRWPSCSYGLQDADFAGGLSRSCLTSRTR